jgi:hypothetical protein
MAFGWDGATPLAQDDGAGTLYELGQTITVAEDITITAVRVWHGPASNTIAGRSARFWTTGGSELDAVLLDDVLPSGWTEYPLDAPLERTAGSSFVLSYSTRQYYGAVASGTPNTSADGALTFTEGRFRDGVPAEFPNVTSTTFYGIDVVYDLGIGGNVAPVVTLAVDVDLYEVTATASVTDEAPGSVGYRFKWGDGEQTITGSTVATHTYATHGVYPVVVLATDAGGLVDAAAAVAVVNQPGGGMDIEAVMIELADRLRTIEGLAVFDLVPDKISQTPAAIVAVPESITFDAGGRRSTDTLMIPIVVCFARRVPRVGRRELSGFASGHGARSVKTVLESGVYTTLRGIIVKDGLFDVVSIGGTEYLAVVLTADVKG